MKEAFTLLIIDDDEDDKEMFIEAVSEINSCIRCLKASNGYEALQMLQNASIVPDFIFLDLNMPRMNGKQCLRQLKMCEKMRSIPVIIYSTSKLTEDKEDTDKLGAVHFITKPSSIQALKTELAFVFRKAWLKTNQ